MEMLPVCVPVGKEEAFSALQTRSSKEAGLNCAVGDSSGSQLLQNFPYAKGAFGASPQDNAN